MNRFRTLKTKLLYFSILISCLLTFLLSLVEIRHDMAEYNTFVQKEFSRFKETHLLYLADKIWAMEYKDLKKYAENEVQEQWFDSIRIYDIQGSVIATAGTQEPRSLTKKFDLTYHHNDKDVTIGSISLSATTPLFKNVVKERWKSVFAVNGLLVIFIFFCSYLFLEKLVLSRLKEIIAQTKDTNRFHSLKGNPLKISPRTNDEIDLLIKTMNMSSKQLYEELTKRKETEASLKFQAMLLDNIQDHVTATDINGKILYINKAEVKSTMRPKSELLQQSVEIYGEDNTRGVTQKEIIENTLKNGKWRGEVINYNASGDEIVMDCRTQVIFDDNGNPSQLVGISTDITDQKRFETEKGFLVTAIEQAAETILVTDAKGNIKYANSAFEKLTGYSREDVINKNPKILKSGNHDSVFYERLWNTISSGKVWKGEITNRNKEGNSFIEEATISPVREKRRDCKLCRSKTRYHSIKKNRTEITASGFEYFGCYCYFGSKRSCYL